MNCRILLFAWVTALTLATQAEARKWTDVNGNQISADYVRIHEGEVILRQGTRLLRCPYDQFSEEDKAYIRDQMEAERDKSKRRAGLDQISGPETSDATEDGARELRTWQDLYGRKTLARYAGFTSGHIELLQDGQCLSYPYAAFSPMDQSYVAQILTAEGRSDEIPKAKTADGQGSAEETPDYSGENSPMDGRGGYSGPGYRPPHFPAPPQYGGGGSHEPDDSMGDESVGGSASHFPGSFPGSGNPSPGSDDSWQSPSSFEPPQLVMKKKCMRCNNIVPDDTKVGDRCPHCNVKFGYEVGVDGERTSAGESWFFRNLVIRLAIFGFVAFVVVAAVLSRR